MKNTYNWGIMAPGKIAHKFALGLSATDKGRLFAVGSRSIAKAEEFAKKFNIPNAYGSYSDLMQDRQVDIIYVATPHHLHYVMTKQCLENGKHVLCEKPVTINQKQFEELSQLARERNLFYMDAFWTRFNPGIEYCLEQLPSIGSIKFLRADFCFKAPYDPGSRIFNRSLGGGSLLDIGIYPVFFALLILGYPDEIKSMAIKGETDVDHSMSTMFYYNSGALASLSSSFITNTRSGAEIGGTKGSILLSPKFHVPQNIRVFLNDGTYKSEKFTYKQNAYEYEAEEVMNCLDKGLTESPRLSHEFTSQLMQLLDEIRRQIDVRYADDEKL